MSRLPTALACVLGVVAQSANAQAQRTLEEARQAVAESYAQVESMVAQMRQDSVQRFALPIARRYSGMSVHADTTQMPAQFMRALDDAYSAVLKNAVAVIGQRAHSVMTGMNVTIARGSSADTPEEQVTSRFVTFRTDPTGSRGFWYQTAEADPPNHDVIRSLVLDWFNNASYEGMPANVRRWLGQIPSFERHARMRREAMMYYTYREIARTNKKSSVACLEGALSACRSLIAIEPGNDTAGSWLDAAERLDMVRTIGRRGRDYLERRFGAAGIATNDRCIIGGGDDACRDALRITVVRAPIGSTSRIELLLLAIARGGPDAYGRLESAKANDIGDILAITAGVPLDTLISEWRSMVMAAEPQSPAPNFRELIVSAVLILGALAVAAGRRV